MCCTLECKCQRHLSIIKEYKFINRVHPSEQERGGADSEWFSKTMIIHARNLPITRTPRTVAS